MNKIGVIIVAGGSGLRMQSDIPKQFIEIDEKPILQHTLDLFYKWNSKLDIVLVLPKNEIETWKNIVARKNYKLNYKICSGGEQRFFSVKNGLDLLSNEIVMVHDAVRPIVSDKTLNRCIDGVIEKGSAIPVVAVVESIRKVLENSSEPVDRDNYKIVQTPQCFKSSWLKKAYKQEFSDRFTDDASVIQEAGYPIYLVDGNSENIKITTQGDLKLASHYLGN